MNSWSIALVLAGALVGLVYQLWLERQRKRLEASFQNTLERARQAGFAEGVRSVRRGSWSEREHSAYIEGLTDCRRCLLAEALEAPPGLTPTRTTGRPEESETRI